MTTQEINSRINWIRANYSCAGMREMKRMNKELISYGQKPLSIPDPKDYYSNRDCSHKIEGNNWYW